MIFGPAETNEKFRKELKERTQIEASKIRDVIKTDKITDNQLKALVRDYYNK